MIPLFYFNKQLLQGVEVDPELELIILSLNLHFRLHQETQKSHPFAIPQWQRWPKQRKIKIHTLAAVFKLHGVEILTKALSSAKTGSPQDLLHLLRTISRVSAPTPLVYTSENIFAYRLDTLEGYTSESSRTHS